MSINLSPVSYLAIEVYISICIYIFINSYAPRQTSWFHLYTQKMFLGANAQQIVRQTDPPPLPAEAPPMTPQAPRPASLDDMHGGGGRHRWCLEDVLLCEHPE